MKTEVTQGHQKRRRGRPVTDGVAGGRINNRRKRIVVPVRLTPQEYDFVREISDKSGLTTQETVERMVLYILARCSEV